MKNSETTKQFTASTSALSTQTSIKTKTLKILHTLKTSSCNLVH